MTSISQDELDFAIREIDCPHITAKSTIDDNGPYIEVYIKYTTGIWTQRFRHSEGAINFIKYCKNSIELPFDKIPLYLNRAKDENGKGYQIGILQMRLGGDF